MTLNPRVVQSIAEELQKYILRYAYIPADELQICMMHLLDKYLYDQHTNTMVSLRCQRCAGRGCEQCGQTGSEEVEVYERVIPKGYRLVPEKIQPHQLEAAFKVTAVSQWFEQMYEAAVKASQGEQE